MPCHLICSAVQVEILLMLIRVIKRDVQSTSVEVHGKTSRNCTAHGIFGLRAKYTQAKELFYLGFGEFFENQGRYTQFRMIVAGKCFGLS